METTEEFFRMQAEAARPVAAKLGVGAEDIGTDVESFPCEPPFVVWDFEDRVGHFRYGHYENGIVTETTGQ